MKLQSLILLLFISFISNKQYAQSKPISHEIFDGLLKKHVNAQGNVDYNGFKKDAKELDSYLNLLAKNEPNKQWPQADQIAYWINVYNAHTISLVAKNYPVKSIKEIKPGISFINSVWDIKFIKIGDKTYDLNNIEHSILRKKFTEPRIHFAINCASFSCPALRNEAYIGSKLESQLTDAAKNFLADKNKNNIEASKIQISKIFDWFGGDFKKSGSLISFLNKYSPIKINDKAKISYMDYLWDLNKQ